MTRINVARVKWGRGMNVIDSGNQVPLREAGRYAMDSEQEREQRRLNKSFTQQPTSDTQRSQIPGIHISANTWMQMVKHRTEGGTLRRDIEGSRCRKEKEEREKERGRTQFIL
jgi:hypothetical protein